MKRKVLSLVLALMLALMLSACGSTENAVTTTAATTTTAANNEDAESAFVREMPSPADSFAGGSGTEDDPWQISTAEELYRFSYVMDPTNFSAGDEEFAVPFYEMYYILTDDIVLNDVSDYDNWGTEAPENGWLPVRTSTFKGQLDGAGHTITGLYCYAPKGSSRTMDAGLFESLMGGAVVRDLNLEKCFVIAETGYAGGIAGTVIGAEVVRCNVNGTVIGKNLSSGGIAGSVNCGIISGCSFTGQVENVGNAGGIAGTATGSIIDFCNVSGSVRSESYAGGVTGMLGNFSMVLDSQDDYPELWEKLQSSGVIVSTCNNSAEVVSVAAEAGGIVGIGYSGTVSPEYWTSIKIENCTNTGRITSEAPYNACRIGGICGSVTTSTVGEGDSLSQEVWSISECTNSGEIFCASSAALVGGILGDANMYRGELNITSCTVDGKFSTEVNEVTLGGIVGLITSYDAGTVVLSDLTNMADLSVGGMADAGGILGSVVIAGRDEMGASFAVRRCVNMGEIISPDGGGSHLGGICGSFLEGLDKDDFRGTVELEGCKYAGDIPPIGSSGSVVDYLEKWVEAIEAEKNK